jgi:DHA2 family multidrug resistance protein
MLMIGLSCLVGAGMTSAWIRENFYAVQWLQIFGQPMAVLPLLMLATNGMAPAEGPFASAWFNTVKGFAVVVGTGVTEGLTTMRERFHMDVLIDQLGNRSLATDLAQQACSGAGGLDPQAALVLFSARMHEQALVLASADVLRVMAVLSFVLVALIPVLPTRIYPPRPVAQP